MILIADIHASRRKLTQYSPVATQPEPEFEPATSRSLQDLQAIDMPLGNVGDLSLFVRHSAHVVMKCSDC